MIQADIMRRAAELMRSEAGQWKSIRHNSVALDEIEGRIADVGKDCDLITYSTLMQGINVDPSLYGSGPLRSFPNPPWNNPNNQVFQEMLSEFLRVISMISVIEHGFMASVLVVYAGNQVGIRGRPAPEFYGLARELNLFAARQNKDQFFKDQKAAACDFYKQNPCARLVPIALKKVLGW